MGSGISQTEMNHTFKPKPEERKADQPSWNNFDQGETAQEIRIQPRAAVPMSGLKLVLPDEDVPQQQQEKKVPSTNQLNASKEGFGRRILIEPPKEIKAQPQPAPQAQPPVVQQLPINQITKSDFPTPITETRIKDEPIRSGGQQEKE